jgi:hypothetical protein
MRFSPKFITPSSQQFSLLCLQRTDHFSYNRCRRLPLGRPDFYRRVHARRFCDHVGLCQEALGLVRFDRKRHAPMVARCVHPVEPFEVVDRRQARPEVVENEDLLECARTLWLRQTLSAQPTLHLRISGKITDADRIDGLSARLLCRRADKLIIGHQTGLRNPLLCSGP